MNRILSACLLVLLVASPCAQAEVPAVVTFDNGARFVALDRDDTPLVTFAVSWARDPGSASVESALDEVLARTLLASQRGGGDRSDLAIEWSAELDTSRLHFVVSAPRESVSRAATLLLDVLEDQVLEPSEFARVREEVADLAARKRAHPFWVAEDEIARRVLQGPGRPVVLQPVPDRVRGLGESELLERARTWLRGPGTTVCVVGRAPEDLQQVFRNRVGRWSESPAPAAPRIGPSEAVPEFVRVPVAGFEVAHVRIGRARPAHPGRAELSTWAADRVADRAIASGFTSLLVETLRGEHGLIYGAGVLQTPVAGHSAASITTSCAPEALPEVLQRTRRTLERALESGLSADRFQAARNTLWVEWAQAFETAGGLCRAMDRGLIDSGDPMLWRRRLRAIEVVEPQAFLRSIRAFDPAGLSVVIAGPGASTGVLKAAWENP